MNDDKTSGRKPSRSRRGRGEGSIVQQADGRWRGRIEVGRTETGKRIRKVVYGATKKQVADKLIRLVKAKMDGTLVAESKQTVGEFLDTWLADVVKVSRRPSTYVSYEQNVRVHIKPAIGSIRLTKLTPQHVQGMYAEMARQGKSARLRQIQHAILRRALSVAVKQGPLVRNVCDAVERPTAPKHEITPIGIVNIQKLITEAEETRLRALIPLAAMTGLRQGELFGLHWDDIDLNAGTLNVRRTTSELDGKVVTSPPKTAQGQRLVMLGPEAVKVLWQQRSMLMTEGLAKCPIVFPTEDGNYQRRFGPFREQFNAIIKAAGCPDLRFHDLRHSMATLMLGEGIHPKIVQEILGHSTIGITMDTYSHVIPSMQKDATSKLDQLFRKKAE